MTTPVDTASSPHASLRTLSSNSLKLIEGFWKQRQMANRHNGLQHGYRGTNAMRLWIPRTDVT